MEPTTRTQRLWIGVGLALTNAVIGAALLLTLSEHLRSRHLDGVPAVGMGQAAGASRGLGSGSDAADEAIAIWTAWAEQNPGRVGWKEVAGTWLLADTFVFALAGYGLLSLMVLLLARGPGGGFAPNVWRGLWVGTGVAGVALALVDVIENTTALIVVASTGGDVVSDMLTVIRSVKWAIAAIVFFGLVVSSIGTVIVGVGRSVRKLTSG